MEKIVLAKSAGFCYGVARAVKLAEDLAERYPGSARMLGPVIHNRHVVEALARRGMAVLSSPEEAGPGDRVLLRAHGEAAGVGEVLRARGAELVDATCPRVAVPPGASSEELTPLIRPWAWAQLTASRA